MRVFIANDKAAAGIETAVEELKEGALALDAIESGLKLVEDDKDTDSAGTNGLPNILGETELDASVMDGKTLRTGSVGAIRGVRYPISLARKVLSELPHEFLVGYGAIRFAKEMGLETIDPRLPSVREAYDNWKKTHVPKEQQAEWPEVSLAKWFKDKSPTPVDSDTAISIAIDATGNIGTGTTTSGWPFKYPGRIGDSPIVGAGHYCNTRYGAAACTHTGEMAIRAGTSRATVLYMKMGMSVEDACREAMKDLSELVGGALGTIVLYAIDPAGNHFCISSNKPGTYWLWREGDEEAQCLDVVLF